MKFRIPSAYRIIFRGLFYAGALMAIATAVLIRRQFGAIPFGQMLFHLRFGTDGLLVADGAMVWRFVIFCGVLPLAAALLILWGERHFAWLRRPWVPALCGLLALMVSFDRLSIWSYLRSFAGPDHFQGAYINPKRVKIEGDHPKSLVIIYVESLESTFGDRKLFGRNLLEPLTKLGARGNSFSFSDYRQAYGGGWTIAGIVASQCGLPFKETALLDGNSFGKSTSSFLAKATCLGNILQANGYRNVFINGGDLRFAGKGMFLNQHGFHEAYGMDYWRRQKRPAEHVRGWGLTDEEMFKFARQRISDLVAVKRPFLLSLLTVRTHPPDGLLSPECETRGLRGMAGAVECSAGEVADFVSFIQSKGWLDRMNVVVIGDHLSMPNAVNEQLIAAENANSRRLYNLFISNQNHRKNTERVSHFDMLPTLLHFIGFRIEGGRLGLGYNALGDVPNPHVDYDLTGHSRAYDRLW